MKIKPSKVTITMGDLLTQSDYKGEPVSPGNLLNAMAVLVNDYKKMTGHNTVNTIATFLAAYDLETFETVFSTNPHETMRASESEKTANDDAEDHD